MEEYTLAAVQQHTKSTDAWIVVHNKVYDVTNYLEDHPGGSALLLEVAGKDATEEFVEAGHSAEANEALEALCVGHLPEDEHADIIEVYRPTYDKVPQVAAVATRPNSSSRLIRRFFRAALKLGMSIGLGAGVWGAATGNFDVSILHKIQQHAFHFSATNGRFWWGFGIATVAQVSTGVSLVAWAWSKLDGQKEFGKYAPRRVARKDMIMPAPKAKPSTTVTLKPSTSRVLVAQQWRPFKLVRKVAVSPNVYRLIFALPHHDDVLGLPTGQHIALRATIQGQAVSRSYTPVSNNSDLGRIELLIKVYDKGLMTKHLEGMQIGQTIDIRGPKGSMKYTTSYAKHIGMVAGGTGITPMYQMIRAICADESDGTKMSLIYANNTDDDILLRDELDGFALQCPEKFHVHYVLAKPPPDWTGGAGFVSSEMMKKYLPAASEDSKVLLCGPPPMINAMKKNLAGLGFKEPGALSKAKDQVFLF